MQNKEGEKRKISTNEPRKKTSSYLPVAIGLYEQHMLKRSATSTRALSLRIPTRGRAPREASGLLGSAPRRNGELETRASGGRRAAAPEWPFSQIAYLCCVSYMVDSSHSIGLMDSN